MPPQDLCHAYGRSRAFVSKALASRSKPKSKANNRARIGIRPRTKGRYQSSTRLRRIRLLGEYMRTSGFTRIVVVISTAWLVIVAFYTHRDFEALERGESSPRGLAVLRDSNTGKTFGGLSKSEVQELGRLKAELALLEKRESKEAKELLGASLTPTVAWRNATKWGLIPNGLLWTLYLSICWIVNGFRKP